MSCAGCHESNEHSVSRYCRYNFNLIITLNYDVIVIIKIKMTTDVYRYSLRHVFAKVCNNKNVRVICFSDDFLRILTHQLLIM